MLRKVKLYGELADFIGYKELDAVINSTADAIKFLISKDYYVIRLGDKPTPKVKYENKNFIDLPYTNLKSEIMLDKMLPTWLAPVRLQRIYKLNS